ncbi:MAG: leucine--tRNA ligase [Simkaniaceae bacterium]
MEKYDHRRIEAKWQKYWEENNIFKSQLDSSKPKYYILDMFPYPSGAGLHVGHVTGYTATDILARFKRQKGFNVLHPMGWDSFGLPAEQYAVRTGTHPKITTEKNINTYRRQLKSLGFSYDWDREIATSDPKYYKWTQWIFTQLFEKGLAYEAEVLVNYCPALGTVLANEEVEDGRSKEGGYPIERRPLRQWILKITEYADRLLEDLENLDWPESLKKIQRNWIGRSEGAKVIFLEEKTNLEIPVFTTRPDTLFGATFLVLSPEHPAIEQITQPEQKAAVEEYKKAISGKSDLERTDLSKDKTGVWTGTYAINPVNQESIPVWIGDYVLMSYGTGAIMSVPAHDERDFEFAKKYHLTIRPIFDPDVEAYQDKLETDQISENIRMEVFAGKICWPYDGLIINSSSKFLDLNGLDSEKAKEKVFEWLENNGKGAKTVNYKLRDWLFSRQRYWGEPIPVLHFKDGSKRALDLTELPLCPPEIQDFRPAGDGQSPLAKIREWVEVVDPKTGKKAVRETNTMPQWAGSCWYYLRFCDPHNDKAGWGRQKEDYWMPVDMYIGGVEHAVLHLLYARFWHKVLYDLGHVSTSEPFQALRNQGLVTAKAYKLPSGGYVPFSEVEKKDGKLFDKKSGQEVIEMIEKMSKSKFNGVSPDEIIEEFGADSLRLYEMFMGPFDKEKLWNTDAVQGCYRFLRRFYDLFYSDKVSEDGPEEAYKLGHRLVAGVEKDIEELHFNTAIAKMMEFLNDFSPLPKYPKQVLKMAVQVLYPFAPHIAEELWERLKEKEPLTYAPFPKYEKKYLIDEELTYVVQVNGKVRGKELLPTGKSKEELIEIAKNKPNVQKFLDGEIVKVIFVPNKLINFVVKS